MVVVRPVTLVLLLAVPLLAGCMGDNTSCTNGSGGQACEGKGSLTYNGASNGSHHSSRDCDDSGEIRFNANVGSGRVTVSVKDGNGATVYSKTAEAAGQTTEHKDLTGASGTWTITATRSGLVPSSFSGQYEARLSC